MPPHAVFAYLEIGRERPSASRPGHFAVAALDRPQRLERAEPLSAQAGSPDQGQNLRSTIN